MTTRGRGNLPAELNSFVGRRSELAEARRLLSKARLVTCTGPGGVGKSRLALRVAAETQRAFSDGVYLVELAHLEEDRLVADAVAGAFGLLDHGTEPTPRLADYLSGKHLLLVLDNCEHLVDACGVLAAKLLAAAPRLHILASSRQLLGVEGEHILPVHPLGLPPADAAAGEAEMLASEAVTLFADRVTANVPTFRLASENLPTVHRICQRLEGIPLAIELAAARCRALGLAELEARLDDTFGLLSAGPRVTEPRQRTLEAAVGWSYALCTPEEQRLWARLSVFADGFGIDAAEQVCAGEAIDRAEVFDLIARLVDKSVATRIEGSYGRQARFRLLETLRTYGLRQLVETGEASSVRSRHFEYFRGMVYRAESEYFHPGEVDSLADLRREHGNLRAALEFCLADRQRIGDALDLAAHLRLYWFACGHIREGVLWLTRVLRSQSLPTLARARALMVCAQLSQFCGELADADDMLTEARSLAERFGDDRTRADVDECAGLGAIYRADIPAALAALDLALTRYRSISDDLGVYGVQLLRAVAALTVAPDEGRAAIEDAWRIVGSAKAGWLGSYVLWVSSLYRLRDGEVTTAAALACESLTTSHRTNDQRAIDRCVRVLAWCAAATRDYQRAATLLGAAEMLRKVSGAAPSYPHVQETFEHYEDETHEALSVPEFDASAGNGAAMDVDDAVEYALSKTKEAPSGVDRSASEPAQLTRRETEIARLVGEGLTNQEIAARLVISKRTAEAHVEHILTKLGFRSRAQIAAWIGAIDAQE